GSQAWSDASSHAHTIGGSNASVQLSTSAPLFGSACLLLPDNGFLWSAVASADFQAGVLDFAIEIGFKTSQPSTQCGIVDFRTTANQVAPTIFKTGGAFGYQTSLTTQISGGTVLTNTWQRLAYCRVSGVGRLFVDGTQVGSNYTDSNNYNVTNYPIWVGGAFNGANHYAGFADELRYTVGDGRHSANYTVDAAAFPNS
ncbi:MAG TPA: LamG-like jellyroll fold domain-containing protein, partial [Casimicrobiaceae bacterium]|nr:LamG-like jellyroll fold domain-containing protein [Casimicrobiaceae bacterium]